MDAGRGDTPRRATGATLKPVPCTPCNKYTSKEPPHRAASSLYLGRVNPRALLTALAIALLLMGRKVFANIVTPQRLRNDAAGSGRYGATRHGHIHAGVDLLVIEGEAVRSPIAGTVARITNAYANSTRWKGVVIDGDGYQVKILYVQPVADLAAGDYVLRGEVIGHAQAISEHYPGTGMKDHIHVEVRTLPGMHLVDPNTVLVIA